MIFAFSILLLPTGAYAQDITSGLVGHWTFNEGSGTVAGDSSGLWNTGTLINGPVWSTGKIGGALDFDGSDDYISTGNFIEDTGTLSANRRVATIRYH
jgi:hypothetical protein